MKLTGLFLATSAMLFVSACSQENEEVVNAADQVTDVVEEVSEAAEETVASASMFATAALIDPNTASADVIAAIPGLNAALAEQVVSGRPYATPSALHAVLKDSVDEAGLKTIYSAMFVTVDLNTGSNDDYRLIPSTLSPGHLAHEFEEYRPYDSLEQFSREMSKYVSDEEVIFLRRYVTIN